MDNLRLAEIELKLEKVLAKPEYAHNQIVLDAKWMCDELKKAWTMIEAFKRDIH